MDKKGTFYYIAIIVGVLLVVGLCWYLLREPNVHDQRERANDVRNELINTGNAQRDAQGHIDNAGRGIDRSINAVDEIAGGLGEAESRIAESEKRNAECAEIVSDSERRIEESRAIIQGIRSRAGQNGK